MKLPTTIKAPILTRTTTEFFAENTTLNSAKPPDEVIICHNYTDGSLRRVTKFDDGSRFVEEFDTNGMPSLVCATDTHGTITKLTQLDSKGNHHTENGYPSYIGEGWTEYRRHGKLHNLNGYATTNDQGHNGYFIDGAWYATTNDQGHNGYFIDGAWYTTDADYVKGIRAWLIEHPEESSSLVPDPFAKPIVRIEYNGKVTEFEMKGETEDYELSEILSTNSRIRITKLS